MTESFTLKNPLFLPVLLPPEEGDENNYVYLLECKDGTLYCGWTNNLKKRLQRHRTGKGAKYTKARLPVQLVYFERFTTSREARQREYKLRNLTRKEKLALLTFRENRPESD